MKLTEFELQDMFNEMLDEIYEAVSICGYTYIASHALKEIDPIAYEEEYNNWIDFNLKDGLFYQWPDESIHNEPYEEEV